MSKSFYNNEEKFNIEPLVNDIEILIRKGVKNVLVNYMERYEMLEKSHELLLSLPSIVNEFDKIKVCNNNNINVIENENDNNNSTILNKKDDFKKIELDEIIKKEFENIKLKLENVENKLNSLDIKNNNSFVKVEKKQNDYIGICNNTLVSVSENENIKLSIKEEVSSILKEKNKLFNLSNNFNVLKKNWSESNDNKEEEEEMEEEDEEEEEVEEEEKELEEEQEEEEDEELEKDEEEEGVEEDLKEEVVEEEEDEEEIEAVEVVNKLVLNTMEKIDIKTEIKEIEIQSLKAEVIANGNIKNEIENDVEEEEEYVEIEIDNINYCTNNEENGFIYTLTSDGDIGNKIGYLKDGEPFFYDEEI